MVIAFLWGVVPTVSEMYLFGNSFNSKLFTENNCNFAAICRLESRLIITFKPQPAHPHPPSHKGKAAHSNGPQTPHGTSPQKQSSASPPHRPADKTSAPACSWRDK